MDAVTYDYDANAHTYATTRYTTPLNRAFSQQNTPCASSEYTYDHAVVSFYGYRYYSPGLGRWISRDPIQELAFYRSYVSGKSQKAKRSVVSKIRKPTYVFCDNAPTDSQDPFGLTNDPGDFGGPTMPPGYTYMPLPNPPPLWTAPDAGDGSIVIIGGGGISFVHCCNEKKQRVFATFWKWCIGPYVGASVTIGLPQGLNGCGCPMSYEGWFIEAGGGYGFGAGGGSLSPDGNVGVPSVGIGLYGGVMMCKYTLMSSEIVGCCK